MKRVSIVNLGGRAFHVEDEGVTAIETWLDDARTRLAADPDRDELLADFERAIADKCEALAPGERDVVTAEQATDIVATLGTVELPATDSGEAPTEPIPAAGEGGGWRERRLYRLTGKDESMLAGVCSGLAAYLNIDVTVVRIVAVLLAIVTSGLAILVYVAMALIVPEADSPDKRAAVRGYGETAQELMSRARDGAGPALASTGSLIRKAWTAIAQALRWMFLAITWLLLAAWGVAIVLAVTDGDGIVEAFDTGTSDWLIALWVMCAAWITVSITLGIAMLMRALTPGARPRGRHAAMVGSAWAASVVVAFIALWAIPWWNSEQLRDLSRDGQARIEMFGETFCIDDPGNTDAPNDDERCRKGDVVLEGDGDGAAGSY